MSNVTYATVAYGRPYWMQSDGGTSIAPESARKPITAEQIAEAEAGLAAIAARIRKGVTA